MMNVLAASLRCMCVSCRPLGGVQTLNEEEQR